MLRERIAIVRCLAMAAREKTTTLVLVAVCLVASFGLSSSQAERGLAQEFPPVPELPQRPNIVFVLTDDLAEKDMRRLHGLQEVMGAAGTAFENAYVTYSLCCPSRATILRGQYPHNHQILSNTPPMGGGDKFRETGLDQSTFATWLDAAGYQTAYIGKYFNGYDELYTPPGWDEWFAVLGSPKYQQYNDNGAEVQVTGHSTDLFADETADFIRRASANPEPFFAFVGTNAPHNPPEVAERYQNRFSAVPLPKPPNFNEADVSDKPEWVRSRPLLSERRIDLMQNHHRERLASMLSVEDLLRKTVATLEETGELDNTYIFFASDNGYHLGQHRLIGGKLTPYEEDISIPLMVRGPGVPTGQILSHQVLNNDLAPTFADLAGVPIPDFVDGRSLKPLLTDAPPPLSEWRTRFLVEGWRIESSIKAVPEIPDYKELHLRNYVFVRYVTDEHELYYLPDDPYQLNSKRWRANNGFHAKLGALLEQLASCAGDSCRAAEN